MKTTDVFGNWLPPLVYQITEWVLWETSKINKYNFKIIKVRKITQNKLPIRGTEGEEKEISFKLVCGITKK